MTNKLLHSAFRGCLFYWTNIVGHFLPLSQFAVGQSPQVLVHYGQCGAINSKFLIIFTKLLEMVPFGLQLYITFNKHVLCRSKVLLMKLNAFLDQLQCEGYYHTTYLLTFQGQMGQYCPMKCTFFLSRKENTALQWALKLNSAPAAAENWHLKGYMLKMNMPHK